MCSLSAPLFAGLALAVLSPVRAAPEPDYAALCAGLGHAPREHPYLIFAAGDKPAILARIRADRELTELMEKMRLEGRRWLYATEEPPAPPRESHTRYVGSDDYLAYINRHSGAAVTLAFLYQMTGDTRYAKAAFSHADRLCALDSWVQSPHRFDVIYPRVWPYGAKDDEVVFTYDITSAGVTRDLSYVYDWLYPALTKAQRDRIRSGLLEKAVTRVRGSYDYFWWAHASRCNWSGICHSGLGLAALTLLDEDPGLTDVIAHSCDGVWNLLQHVGPDGGWQEGRGYWAYGMGESVMFMDAIKRATGGRIDFFHDRAFFPHPADFALFGLTAGFGDGTGQPVGSSFLLDKLAAETGDGRAAWYRRHFVPQTESVFDLIWPDPGIAASPPADGSRWFRGIDWAVMRRDFTPAAMTVACKAGMNDDPHHGHLDCGTFNLTWHGVSYVGEVARSPYDEQYFGAQRWDHLEASTEAHNVVLVDGEEQICAKEKDQPWKSGIGGRITQFGSGPEWTYAELDPTHAYPGRHLRLWHRWILLDKTDNAAVIVDRVGSAAGASVEIRFHPNVPFALSGAGAVLHGESAAEDGGGARGGRGRGGRKGPQSQAQAEHAFYSPNSAGRRGAPDLEWTVASPQAVRTLQGREPDLPVTEEEDFSWVPYFSAVSTAGSADTVVASVFAAKGAATNVRVRADADGQGATVEFTLGEKPIRCHVGESSVQLPLSN